MAEYLSPGVYAEEFDSGPRVMGGVSTSIAGFIGMAEAGPTEGKIVRITNMGEYQRVFGGPLSSAEYGPNCYLAYAVEGFFTNGGTDCYVMRVAGDAGNPKAPLTPAMLCDPRRDVPGKRIGLDAFKEVPNVSILAIPGRQSDDVQALLVAHCEKMRNRFAILDAGLDESTAEQLAKYKDKIDSGYCAIYAPWLQVYSRIEQKDIFVPPSGAMAGIYARTDATRGVWKAPANEVIRGCAGLSTTFGEAEQGKLNPRGINLIRNIPGSGIRVWGARTLSSDGNWKYINVRRLFIHIEESIRRNTNWVVFEPNDATTWERVQGSVRVFLTTLWRNGALAGTSADEAFYVSVGKGSTMTDEDIKNGRLICEIGVAPVKPAEFIIFHISQQMQGDATG